MFAGFNFGFGTKDTARWIEARDAKVQRKIMTECVCVCVRKRNKGKKESEVERERQVGYILVHQWEPL